MKTFLRKATEAVLGLVVLAVIGAVVMNLLGGAAEQRAEEQAMSADLTLAGYADLAAEGRRMRVTAAAAAVEASDRTDDFVECMGEFAATKSPDLPFDDVFGWCDLERANNPAAFAAHFNELDAADLSMEALTICQMLVKNALASPSTAEFTFVDPIGRGRQRYLIASNVDAQNAFGAMVRARFVCELQHDGVGDPLQVASWTTHRFVVE